jgi:hypothetical protein
MLGKLLSLLVAGKGGGLAAATIVAGATTVSVMTTSPEVQDAVNALSQITSPGMSQLAKNRGDCPDGGQPVVVAQRNAADKLLRAAYQDEHKRLVGLRGGKDVDHQAANEVLRTAERDLRAVLTQALNDVARETLGREGHLKLSDASPTPTSSTESPSPSPTATPTGSPTTTETPKPSCTPKPSASPTPASTASPAASPTGSPAAEARGRVAVADRVTLDAKLQGIVDKAKADMKQVVDKAEADIAALPAAERGRPGDKGKPSAVPGTAADKKPADAGKPSDRPGGRPSDVPRRP